MEIASLVLMVSISMALCLISAVLFVLTYLWIKEDIQKPKKKVSYAPPKTTNKARHIEWDDEEEFENDFDYMFLDFEKKRRTKDYPNWEKPIGRVMKGVKMDEFGDEILDEVHNGA